MTTRTLARRWLLGATLAVLAAAPVACAATAEARALDRKLAAPVTASWRDAQVGPAMRRLADAFSTPLWIDRRVDPTTRFTLAVADRPLRNTFQQLAEQANAAITPFGPVVYVGPKALALRLNALSIEQLPRTPPSLRRRQPTSWPKLTTPRGLVQQLAKEARVQVTGLEAIPHDLMPNGSCPSMSRGDQLTLALVGFDLRWLCNPATPRSLSIEPIDYASLAVMRPRPTSEPIGAAAAGESRFTLRVVEQPAAAILQHVAKQTGRIVELPEGVAESAARRITLEVRGATLDQLVAEIAEKSELRIEIEPDRIVVRDR